MDGIFIHGKRPTSKKQVKEAVTNDPDSVVVERTSLFGAAGNGFIADLIVGERISFVGPDPYTSRKFYGTIQRTATGFRCA